MNLYDLQDLAFDANEQPMDQTFSSLLICCDTTFTCGWC